MGRAPHCSSSSRNDKNGLKKGPWTQEEDQMLIDYIQKHGSGNWRNLPKKAGLERCGKSCRLRWTNYLRPDIKRGRFTFEEEDAIIQLHSILGNKWSAIAGHLPGRTDNEIKNFWNTRIRKRLLKMGIDPVTHRPQLNLVRHQLSSIVNSYLYNNPPPPAADQIVMNNNMSRFLGLENNHHHHQQQHPCGSLLNPEMLERATSLLLSSSQHRQQNSPSDFHMPQHNEEILPPRQLFNNNDIAQIQSQPQFGALPPLIQTCSPTLEEEPPFPASAASPCFPYSSSEQPQLFDHSSSGTYPLNISDFDVQFLCDIVPNCTAAAGSEDGRERQIHDTDTALPSEFQNYNPAGSDPRDHSNLLDTWSENSTIDRSCRQDFFTSPQSVFSTSSSSPTPLNSTTTNATTDDERESYCSSIFRFDSPHIFEGFII